MDAETNATAAEFRPWSTVLRAVSLGEPPSFVGCDAPAWFGETADEMHRRPLGERLEPAGRACLEAWLRGANETISDHAWPGEKSRGEGREPALGPAAVQLELPWKGLRRERTVTHVSREADGLRFEIEDLGDVADWGWSAVDQLRRATAELQEIGSAAEVAERFVRRLRDETGCARVELRGTTEFGRELFVAAGMPAETLGGETAALGAERLRGPSLTVSTRLPARGAFAVDGEDDGVSGCSVTSYVLPLRLGPGGLGTLRLCDAGLRRPPLAWRQGLAFAADAAGVRLGELCALEEPGRQCRQEQRLLYLLSQMPQWAWSATVEGRVDFVNRGPLPPAPPRLNESSRGADSRGNEARGPENAVRPWVGEIHPDDLPGFEQAWEVAAAEGNRFRRSVRIRLRPSGTFPVRYLVEPTTDPAEPGGFEWVDVDAVRVCDDQGTPVRWFGTTAPIHEHVLEQRRLTDTILRLSDLQALLDTAPGLIGILDLQTRPILLNPAWSTLLGWSPAELQAMELIRLAHPDDLPRVREALTGMLARGDRLTAFRCRVLTRHGRALWFRWECVSPPGTGRLYAVGSEITGQVEAEIERARIDQLMQETEATARIGGWEVDLLDNTLKWSAETYRLHGLDPDHFVPDVATAIEFYEPEFRPLVRRQVERCIEEGAPLSFEARLRPRGQEPIWVRSMGKRRVENGRTVRIYGVIQDIQHVKQADEAVRRSDSMTRAIVETAVDAIVSIDRHGTMVLFNPAAERIFGYRAEDVLGGNLGMLLPPEHRAAFEGSIERYCRTGRGKVVGGHRELTGLKADGSIFPVELSVTEMHFEGERMFLGILRDITERQKMQDELRRAVFEAEVAGRSKSRFLANMSHELRTPMNAVLGLTDLVLAGSLTDEQRADLRVVKDSGQSLLRLLDDLLDFAKLEGGSVQLRYEAFSPRKCLQRLARVLAPAAHDKGLEWIWDVDPNLPESVVGDEGRIEQLVRNLLDNAVKYTQHGSVELSAEVVGRTPTAVEVLFRVRDTGQGIDPADQTKIFQVFTQLDASLRRRVPGAGLGLAICRELAQALGGSIAVDSRLGEGAVFGVRLPLALPSVGEDAPAAPSHPFPDGAVAGCGLLIGSTPAAGRMLARALARFGTRLETAADPAAAVALQQQRAEAGDPFAFALLDEDLFRHAGADDLRRLAAGYPQKATALVGRFGRPRPQGTVSGGDLRIERTVFLPPLDGELLPVLQSLVLAGDASATSPEAPPAVAGPLCVLLAEDTPANRRVIVKLLERRGHEVVTAGTGRQALDRIRERAFDLVLMDIQMPEMDGLDATREIRRLQAAGQVAPVPIVGITAHAFPEERPVFLAAGLDDLLIKPLTSLGLDSLLQTLPGRRAGG